jgi:outer membrane protein assembly factor BamE (lipoprotein component of BamABCDE complex)
MRTASMVALALLLPLGCKSKPPEEEGNQLTTGVVQREIHIGMGATEVVEALGNPNIVIKEDGRETWTYERSARNVETRSQGYFVVFLFGSKESAKSSQKTFTLVLKFDENMKVKDFAYHATSF